MNYKVFTSRLLLSSCPTASCSPSSPRPSSSSSSPCRTRSSYLSAELRTNSSKTSRRSRTLAPWSTPPRRGCSRTSTPASRSWARSTNPSKVQIFQETIQEPQNCKGTVIVILDTTPFILINTSDTTPSFVLFAVRSFDLASSPVNILIHKIGIW